MLSALVAELTQLDVDLLLARKEVSQAGARLEAALRADASARLTRRASRMRLDHDGSEHPITEKELRAMEEFNEWQRHAVKQVNHAEGGQVPSSALSSHDLEVTRIMPYSNIERSITDIQSDANYAPGEAARVEEARKRPASLLHRKLPSSKGGSGWFGMGKKQGTRRSSAMEVSSSTQ